MCSKNIQKKEKNKGMFSKENINALVYELNTMFGLEKPSFEKAMGDSKAKIDNDVEHQN